MAKPRKLPLPNAKPVGAVDVSPDGRHLVVGQQSETEDDAHLSVWSLEDLAEVTVPGRGGNVFVTKARYSADGRRIAYVNSRLELWFYDLEEERLREDEREEDEPVRWLSAARKRNVLLVAGTSTRVLDGAGKKTLWKLPGRARDAEEPVAVGVLSADGKKVAVAGTGEEVVVYSLETEDVLERLPGGPAQATWIAGDAGLEHVAVVDEENEGVYLWDARRAEKIDSAYVGGDAQGYSCAALPPRGGLLALGMRLGFVEVLSIADDEYVLDEEAHDGRVSDLVFTPDGRRLISAGTDGAVLVWDLT